MWKTLPLERFVEHALKRRHAEEGEVLWAKYVDLRTEISNQVLPWIQRNEPDLSDHGVDHIQNVMTNVTQLLGLPREHGREEEWQVPAPFNIHELLLLLFGCLTHDVGNILGRERHNQAIAQAATLAGGGWNQLAHGDRLIVERIGRAHSGKNTEGGKDTLGELSPQSAFFAKHQVRLVEVAAVLRFADELAEGPQRTSKALLALSTDKDVAPELRLSEGSRLYHLYAAISEYNIDHTAGRILIDYDIDRASTDYGTDVAAREATIRGLLSLTFKRALKVNAERQYARHYAESLSRYRETSINLRFNDRGRPIDQLDRTVTISDARTAFEGELTLERLNPGFAIDEVMANLKEQGA
jgi:hypothetical protein